MADQRTFFLTVAQATGLPLRDGVPPTTCVRCKVQSTQQILFCTPYRPSTSDPSFDHKEVVAARYRLLIFEILDENSAVLGGFKIDAQVICAGLATTRDYKMKVAYPLNADKSSVLTLAFQLITNPLATNPNAARTPPAVRALAESEPGSGIQGRSASVGGDMRPQLRPGFQPQGPVQHQAPQEGTPAGSESPALSRPGPLRTKSVSPNLNPNHHHLGGHPLAHSSPVNPTQGSFTPTHNYPFQARPEGSPMPQFRPDGGQQGVMQRPDGQHVMMQRQEMQPNGFRPDGAQGVPVMPRPDGQHVMMQRQEMQPNGFRPDGTQGVPVMQRQEMQPNGFRQDGSQQPPHGITQRQEVQPVAANPIQPGSQTLPPHEVAKLQENYQKALEQIAQLQTELRQTQEALAFANATIAQMQQQQPSVVPQSPIPASAVHSNERRGSESSVVAQPPVIPESRCEICQVAQQGPQRVLLFNHIFCRKCALEMRNTLGRNANNAEALTKYISEKAQDAPEPHSPPEAPPVELDPLSSSPGTPSTPSQSGSFRLFSIDHINQPSMAGTGTNTPRSRVFNPNIPKLPPQGAQTPSASPPSPHSQHIQKRESKEYFVSDSESSEEEEQKAEVLVDFYIPEDPSNILYSDTDGDLKAATFTMLIAKLTQMPSIVDIDDFLLTYRSFTTPAQLIDALMKRFATVKPEEARTCHLRIFNIIGRWVSHYWFDFETDPTCTSVTMAFLDKIISDTSPNNTSNVTVAKNIRTKLEKKRSESGAPRKIFTPEMPPPIFEKDPNQPLLLADSLEIARQITIRTWETWVAIKPWEFLGLAWTKHGKEEKASNVHKMTQQFNNMSAWVSSTIISTPTLAQRVRLIKKFLDIAMHLKTLGNFNGIMEIWSGLQRQPVFRMTLTNQEVMRDRKYNQIWAELAELNDSNKNFQNLRNAIHATNPPVIPYLGMYQSDLVFIEEGNPKKIGELINYFRCRSISAAIKKVQQYQHKGPPLQKVPSIAVKLEILQVIESEEDMYTISSYHEPREGREPGPRPSSLDQYLQRVANAKVGSPGSVTIVRKTKTSFTTAKRRSDPSVLNNSPGAPISGIIRANSGANLAFNPSKTPPKRSSRPPTDDEREKAEALCSAAWVGNLAEVRNILALSGSQNFINLPNSRGQPALYCASRQGHVEVVLELLNADGIDIGSVNAEHGSTALHAASFADQPEVVCLLLFAGADPLHKLNKNGLNARSEARGSTLDVYAHFDQLHSVSSGEENAFDMNAMNALQALRTAFPSSNLLKRTIV